MSSSLGPFAGRIPLNLHRCVQVLLPGREVRGNTQSVRDGNGHTRRKNLGHYKMLARPQTVAARTVVMLLPCVPNTKLIHETARHATRRDGHTCKNLRRWFAQQAFALTSASSWSSRLRMLSSLPLLISLGSCARRDWRDHRGVRRPRLSSPRPRCPTKARSSCSSVLRRVFLVTVALVQLARCADDLAV